LEAYTLHEGALPAAVTLEYTPAIFNHPTFAASQGAPADASFYLLDERSAGAHAAVHFHIDGTTARSPFRAPFGSFDLGSELSARHLFKFVEDIGTKLRDRGVTEIILRNPPREYDVAGYSLLETCLINQGYSVGDAEVSAIIPVRGEPFVGMIRNSEKLRILQAARAGLSFRILSHDQIPFVYEFILRCHEEKKYRLSVSCDDLMRTVKEFPKDYHLFGVFDDEEICAAAVSVRVTRNVLWNFMVNQDTAYNPLSPSVFLMQGIYNYCVEHGIALFDLGTSALHGRPNFSLLDFKLHLGAVPVSKLSFRKSLV
jgi:hypothetical protein